SKRGSRATAAIRREKKSGGKKATAHNAADGSFKPPEVARLYNFPAGLDGDGQCIAMVELNDFDEEHNPTGTGFSVSDLKAYFASLGLPTPGVTAVGVARHKRQLGCGNRSAAKPIRCGHHSEWEA